MFEELRRISKREVHHVHAQALHHHGLHEATVGGSLLEAVASRLEGTGRDWDYGNVFAVTELYHVPIWVMEEHLLHLYSFVFHLCCHIPHPHFLQPPLHNPYVPALLVTQTSTHHVTLWNRKAIKFHFINHNQNCIAGTKIEYKKLTWKDIWLSLGLMGRNSFM